MAEDDFNQRLTQIEARLASLPGEFHDDMIREFSRVTTTINDLRGEVRVASAMLRQLVGAVAGITELLQALSEQGAPAR